MRAEYREGERFERLTFTGETFYDCDFSDCVFADCTFEDCRLDHSVLTECQFLRCTVTNLKTTMSRAKFTDFENCTLNNIDWMSLQGDGAFADPIEAAGLPPEIQHLHRNEPDKVQICRQRHTALDVRQVQSRQRGF